MPNGLWYARGPHNGKEAIPASAFSRGDILMYTSESSLSRYNELGTAANVIAGVALADSDQSFNNKVPYLIAEIGTVFWSRATPASSYTPGEQVDFDVDGAGRPVVVNSQTTPAFVVEEVTVDIAGQSAQSVILGRFIAGTSTSTALLAHNV